MFCRPPEQNTRCASVERQRRTTWGAAPSESGTYSMSYYSSDSPWQRKLTEAFLVDHPRPKGVSWCRGPAAPRSADRIATNLRQKVASAGAQIDRSAGQLQGPPCLQNRAAHEMGSDPSHEAGLIDSPATRRVPASFVTPRTTIFLQALRVDGHRSRGRAPIQALRVDGHRSRYRDQPLHDIGVSLSGASHCLAGARDTGCELVDPTRSAGAIARRYSE